MEPRRYLQQQTAVAPWPRQSLLPFHQQAQGRFLLQLPSAAGCRRHAEGHARWLGLADGALLV